jgi:hypothetical protein
MEPVMVQKTSGIYRLTQIPAIYAAFQRKPAANGHSRTSL